MTADAGKEYTDARSKFPALVRQLALLPGPENISPLPVAFFLALSRIPAEARKLPTPYNPNRNH
jgi:hypothetical protein